MGIRFPTMTLEQLQWEVVPTGLLLYEDVAPLLQYKSRYKQTLNRFNSQARGSPQAEVDLPDQQAGSTLAALQSGVDAYQASTDDPLDSMLSTMLLKTHLRDCDRRRRRVENDHTPVGHLIDRAIEEGYK